MGREHAGFVLGDEHDEFAMRHRGVLTEQQVQGPWCQPRVITFRNNTSVKFYHEGPRTWSNVQAGVSCRSTDDRVLADASGIRRTRHCA